MSGTDYRALCAELLDEVAARPLILDRELIARARAALAAEAEPEAVGLSPEEVEDLCEEHCFNVEGYESIECLQGLINDALARWGRAGLADGPAVPEGREPAAVIGEPSDEELLDLAAAEMNNAPNWEEPEYSYKSGRAFPYEAPGVAWVNFARAVLARYGHQPAPPAEGEVAELVAALRSQAIDCTCDHLTSGDLRRAADLLERQAAPVLEPALARINDILNDSGRILQTDELEALELARQALEQRQAAPVPVAERLPGPEDCDAEGRVWLYRPQTPILNPYWDLVKLDYIDPVPPTHWLPANALPLPQGEVE